MASATLGSSAVAAVGADRLRLRLGLDEWLLSLAGEQGSHAALEAWQVVLNAGSRYQQGLDAHRRLRRAQATSEAAAAAAALARGDAAAARTGFRRSATAAASASPDGSVSADAMSTITAGLRDSEAALAAEASRTEAAVSEALEGPIAQCQELAAAGALDAVKEALRAAEGSKTRADALAQEVASREGQVAALEEQLARSKAAEREAVRRAELSQQSTGGCCGSRPG